MKKQYVLTQEEAEEAKFAKGAVEIADFWKRMGEKYSFNAKTVKFLGSDPKTLELLIEADSTVIDVSDNRNTNILPEGKRDYNAFGEEYALVVTGDRKGELTAKIEAWKEQFGGLKIVDEADKAGYLAVQTAIQQLRTTRGLVEAKRKELKKDPIELGKLIDGTAKEIIDAILPLEEQLKAEKERIDAIAEERKRQKLMEIEKKFNERVAILTAKGMTFMGMGYKLNLLTLGTLEIKAMSDKEWSEFVVKLDAEWSEEQQRVLTAQKEEVERQARLEKEKQEQERVRAIILLGFEESKSEGEGIIYTRKLISNKHESEGGQLITAFELASFSDDALDLFLSKTKSDLAAVQVEIKEANKRIQDEQKRQEQEKARLEEEGKKQAQDKRNQRTASLNQLGYLFDGNNFVRNERFGNRIVVSGNALDFADDKWSEELKEATDNSKALDKLVSEKLAEQEEQKKQQEAEKAKREAEEKQKEIARLEALKPVKEKLLKFADDLENTAYPEVTAETQGIVANAISKIVAIAGEVREAAEKL